ncbi:MAG: fimbrillin family protein [Tidjanibacter sp.]|nr:fimbrillin family protein [Tidjanibacter sp.]
MKKIFIVVLAAIGMVACMNEQITELPTGNEIAFDNAFIDNATRAELTAANLGEFGVWGYISGLGDADNQSVALFEGTEVTNASGAWQYGGGARYWAPGEMHHFQAVAPLTAAVEAVSVAESGKVTAIDYTVDGESDLIYAAYEKQAADAGQDNGPVSFTFNHLLSKVNFAFTNGFGTQDGITLQVKDITMTVPAEGTYTIDGTWSDPTGTTTLDFAAGEQIAANAADSRAPKFVIPADNTKTYAITFKVDVYFNGVLINKDVAKSSTVAGVAFEQGKAYNLTATIDSESLNMESIEFTVGTVEGWVTGGGTTIGTGAAVGSAASLQAALNNPEITNIVLTGNIDLSEGLVFGAPASRAAATTFNGRDITIDGNGATLTYAGSNARIIDVTSEAQGMNLTVKNLTIINDASYCQRGINYNTNGTLTLENVTIKSAEGKVITYAVNFPGSSNEAKANITDSDIQGCIALNVWGYDMVINVKDTDLLSIDNATHENYSAISLCNNGTNSAENTVVNVEGGSITAKDENGNPSSAIRISALTGEVNTTNVEIVGKKLYPVATVQYEGYSEFYSCHSLQAAIDNVVENNSGYIVLIRDIELDEPVVIPAGANISIDLNGKKVSIVDTTEKNFSLIDNRGNLTIKGNGEMTVEATINSGWNRYSAVIANNPGGNLTVEGGVTIEHLGGTDMAYGIDNLTNGKGTYAVTTVKDATVKSTYSAVRQFLNGTEATNELYVKDGAILEATKRSIYFQDPSKSANTGKLVVEAGAQLKGDVRLSLTAGSTEWPVEVSVASAALVAPSAVTTNSTLETYQVKEVNGYWTIVKSANIVENPANLGTAISGAEDGDTLVLEAGNYSMPAVVGKEVTISGNESTVITIEKPGCHGGDVTFEGVTIQASGAHTGVQHVNTVTYNGAKILGDMCLYGEKVVFNECTFELAKGQYIWTYGAEEVEFNNCTFNTAGKAILIYKDGGPIDNKVSVKGCTFNATAGDKAGAIANQNCAAIEIQNYESNVILTTEGNNVDSDFSGEWRIKQYDNRGYKVTVNGVEYTQTALDGTLLTVVNKEVQ